jgi:predicted HD superfamily hydrolase involved in NAD metabolism
LTSTVERTPPTPFTVSSLETWIERVRSNVKPARFEHVMRVAELAREIAIANGLDADRAYLAGVLHDLARDLPGDELLRLAPPESEMDTNHPLALHGRAARAILESEGMTDTDVLEAVEDHVTGPRGGNPIALAVYIADVSEPGRGVNHHIREMAFVNLENAYTEALFCKVTYLESQNKAVHPRTRAAFERLRQQHVLPDHPVCQETTSRAASVALEKRSTESNKTKMSGKKRGGIKETA